MGFVQHHIEGDVYITLHVCANIVHTYAYRHFALQNICNADDADII